MRIPIVLCIIACLLALFGCGGGSNNGGQGRMTPIKFDISWAERSRAVNAPASALSATLTLKGARPDHGDFTFSADRKDDPAAYTQTYTSTNLAVSGTWNATVTFYANKSGQGQVVGVASKSVTIKSDGSGLGDIVTVGTVASVLVTPGQTVMTGQSVDLLFTALDSAGNLLALTPGSAKWNVSGGTNVLQISASGTVMGLQAGTAQVMVTVDGKTSASADVKVIDNVLQGLIAEATSTSGTSSIRLRWTNSLFNGVTVQQYKIFRLPDFPFGTVGSGGPNGGTGTAANSIPVGTAASTLLEFTDLPTPNFFFKAGGNYSAVPSA